MRQNKLICAAENNMTVNETVCESLAIALLKLMNEQEFDKITITNIVQVAGVGRSSFYRNYDSKEELLYDYVITLYKKYFKNHNIPMTKQEANSVEDFLIPRFKFIYDHKSIFTALHKCDKLYYFFKKIERNFLLVLCGQSNEVSPYYSAMLTGSCTSIIIYWIERDFKETVEELANLFKMPLKLI